MLDLGIEQLKEAFHYLVAARFGQRIFPLAWRPSSGAIAAPLKGMKMFLLLVLTVTALFIWQRNGQNEAAPAAAGEESRCAGHAATSL